MFGIKTVRSRRYRAFLSALITLPNGKTVLLNINSNPWSRRRFVKMALTLPLAGLFSRLRTLAAAHTNRVKITDIKVMQIQKIAGNSLIKIETDSGLAGYGEAGVSGPMGRARLTVE